MVKLARLPDRIPVKLTISILPDFNETLADYAADYNQMYGRTESVLDLIPYMLASFIESDRDFAKKRAIRRGQK